MNKTKNKILKETRSAKLIIIWSTTAASLFFYIMAIKYTSFVCAALGLATCLLAIWALMTYMREYPNKVRS